jgi:pseudoazurin
MHVIKLSMAALSAMLISSAGARAAEFTVNDLNMGSHGMFQFDPNFVRIQPGDTVHFIAKDKGHDVRSIPGMLPDGAKSFQGEMNKDVTVTFTQAGVYGVECTPHYGMGMVALIVVGDSSSNLVKAEAVTQPGKAKAAFAKLFQEATQQANVATTKP